MLMKYKDFKTLTQDEMKKIMGGDEPDPPPPPSQSFYPEDRTGCYRCCWTGSQNCSTCELSYSTAACVSGATLTACGNLCYN